MAKDISNQTRTLRNHFVLLKLTKPHVNLLNIKQDFALLNYSFRS